MYIRKDEFLYSTTLLEQLRANPQLRHEAIEITRKRIAQVEKDILEDITLSSQDDLIKITIAREKRVALNSALQQLIGDKNE